MSIPKGIYLNENISPSTLYVSYETKTKRILVIAKIVILLAVRLRIDTYMIYGMYFT